MPVLLAAFCLAYFAAAKLGIASSLPPQGVVIIWPPNALVLAILVRIPRSRWWPLFLATVLTEVAADLPDYPLLAAIGYGTVNFGEAAFAATLLTAIDKRAVPLSGLRGFLNFTLCGPIIASGLAALLGAAIYKLASPDLDYLHYWRVFWFGDALGLLLVGTILLTWGRKAVVPKRSARLSALEQAALGVGLVAAAAWAFLSEPDIPRVYLVFPFLFWAALRFGVRGATIAVLVAVLGAVCTAKANIGPFAAFSNIDTVLALQGMIAMVTVSAFTLAFAMEDAARKAWELAQEVRQHKETAAKLMLANQELERINLELDRTVEIRTSELRRTLSRNEMLLQEVHHRVKNSLQLVTSLLHMHGLSTSEPADLAQLTGQINSIAATYDVIHRTGGVETVDFGKILSELCRNIADAHGRLVAMTSTVTGECVVTADTAVALSLALNELITNSIKHAAAGREAAVVVSCRQDGGNLLIEISDDGPGFPPGFDVSRVQGFGMRMALNLVEQAGGRILIPRSDQGALVQVTTPLAQPA